MAGRRPARVDGVDGDSPAPSPFSPRTVARSEQRYRVGHELRARARPARAGGGAVDRADIGLCAGAGLSRCREETAETSRPMVSGGRTGRAGQGVRRHRAGDGKAAGRGGRDRVAGKAHQPRQSRARQLAVPGRDLHHAGSRAGRAAPRSLRDLPRLSRCLSDRCVSGPLHARCAALHLLPHDRAQGARAGRIPRGAGQPHLWLRRLPCRVPVEQFRPVRRRRARVRAARGTGGASPAQSYSTLDDAAFRALFSGSPIKRIGRDRFVRNCLYAAGNSADRALIPVVEPLLADPDAVVADAARWAMARLRAVP